MRKYGASTTHIRADVGESFVLELPALATGGYTWQMTRKPNIATLSGERTRPGGPVMGSRSIQEFEFVATRAGKDTLLMVYKRPWETTVTDQLEVGLVVRQ